MNIGKPDFSDINKFLVSIGLVLLGLALLTPWLFLQNGSNFLYNEADFDKLTDLSKELAIQSQNYRLIILNSIWKIVIILSLIGIGLTGYGLKRWFKKQLLIDEKEELELKRLWQDYKLLTREETELKAKKEVLEEITTSDGFSKGENDRADSDSNDEKSLGEDTWKNVLEVEDIMNEKIRAYNPFEYEIKQNVKFKDKYEVDFLLQPFLSKKADKIIEVKLLQKRLNFKLAKEYLDRFKSFLSLYNKEYGRKVRGYLVLIYEDNIASSGEIKRFKETISQYTRDIGSSFPLFIMSKSDYKESDRIINYIFTHDKS